MAPGPDDAAASRPQASITARAAGFTAWPASGRRSRQAGLRQGAARSGNAALPLSPAVLRPRRRERFFEDQLTADPAKRIAATLAGITGTLKRCGAGQRDRNLPRPPHHTS